MGFRFRKSIKLAPGVKLNLNKKSTGITFGGKGFHYTVNSKGKRTASVGIPGTGLSYSTTSGGKSSKKKKYSEDVLANENGGVENMEKKSKKKGCLPAIIISLIVVGIIGSCGTDSTDTATTTEQITNSEEYITEEVTTAPSTIAVIAPIETEAITVNITTTEQETTTEKQTTTTEKETTTEKKTTTTQKATTKKETTTEKKTTTKKATTTQKATTTKKVTTTKKPTTTKKVTTTKKKVVTTKAVINNSQKIYRTETGKKYHYENPCGNGDYYEVSLDQALAAGLEPCNKCVLH